MQIQVGIVSGDKNHLSSTGEGSGGTFKEVHLCSVRQKGGELFLCLQFLNCLQLKIILTPECYILGWHLLSPFMANMEVLASFSYLRSGSPSPIPSSLFSSALIPVLHLSDLRAVVTQQLWTLVSVQGRH